MPIFDWKCNCGYIEKDVLNGKKEKCPLCGRTMKKMIPDRFGLVFKGTGFYKTDYK